MTKELVRARIYTFRHVACDVQYTSWDSRRRRNSLAGALDSSNQVAIDFDSTNGIFPLVLVSAPRCAVKTTG